MLAEFFTSKSRTTLEFITFCHLPWLCLSGFENASTFSFLIFKFCHVVEEVHSSCKDALLSISVLIHQMSCYYSLYLGSDAEKCPFGERWGNAAGKTGKGTSSAPYPKHHFTSLPCTLISALCSLGPTCQNTGKRADSLILFWRVRMLRRDSVKHPSFPIAQIRPLTLFHFFHQYLWPHKNPAEIHGNLRCSLDLSCQHAIFFFHLSYQFKQKKILKMKTNNEWLPF